MDVLLFLLGGLGVLVFIILLIVFAVIKKPLKTPLVGFAVSFLLFFIGFFAMLEPIDSTSDQAQSENEPPVQTAEVDTTVQSDTPIVDDTTDASETPSVEDNTDVTETPVVETTPSDSLKSIVDKILDSDDYIGMELDEVVINKNYGDEEGDTYIALIYVNFTTPNTKSTGIELLRMYSDDMAAKIALETDLASEVAVFWTDEYNDRSLKFAYYYEDGAFYLMDQAY
ncbi:hypothetical protein ACR6HW_05065 [Fusibacter sp. JL298sf-3]